MPKTIIRFLSAVMLFVLLGPAYASSRDLSNTPYHKNKSIGGDGFGYLDKHLKDGSWRATGLIFGQHASVIDGKRIAFYRASELAAAAGKKYLIVSKAEPTRVIGRYASSLEFSVYFSVSDDPGDSEGCGYEFAGVTCHTIEVQKTMNTISPQLIFETRNTRPLNGKP